MAHKYVETSHPQKLMGLYVGLAKALNALEQAGEDVGNMSEILDDGLSGWYGRVRWDAVTESWYVAQA